MRASDPAVSAALANRVVVARDFIWIRAKNRETGAPELAGFWSDVGTITAPVIDGTSRAVVSRTFTGAGSLIEISPIPMVADISVRSITVRLSQIDEAVALAIRGYDAKNAPIEIYRGVYDPATMNLVAPAFPRFLGYVDKAPIPTPPAGGEAAIELTCVSASRELTRRSTSVRSDASQRLRNPGDGFYKDVGVVGGWELFWGKKQGRLG